MSSSDLRTHQPVLVTGAGGWIASHLVYQLLDRGYKVRGTVRSLKSQKYAFLNTFHPKAATHLELVEADLLEPEGWDEAVKGCEYVMHVASPFLFDFKDAEKEVIRPAIEGVRQVLKACMKPGSSVKRIIQTSSICSIVFGHSPERYACDYAKMNEARKRFNAAAAEQAKNNKENGLPEGRTSCSTGTHLADWRMMDDSDWSNDKTIVGYELSKCLAEKEAWSLVKEHNNQFPDRSLELTAVCPAFVFGPIFCAAHGGCESSIHILRLLKRTFPFVPPINSTHVDVRDVALGHILAMEGESEKVANQRFVLTADDGNLTFQEQAELLAKNFNQYGFRVPTYPAPGALVRLGSYFIKSVGVACDKLNAITYCSNEKTHKILGLTQWRTTEEALKGHAITLMQCGLIGKKKVPEQMISEYKPY